MNLSAFAEEHLEAEQEGGGEEQGAQGTGGRGRVQRVRRERDQPPDGVDGEFSSSTQNLVLHTQSPL